jgi:hydantoinase/carbamoylase family amidase
VTSTSLPISGSPVNTQLNELAEFNSDPGSGGITREVYTPEYMAAHAYVAKLMTDAGLDCRTDAFGNLIGRLAGLDPSLPGVLTGSHIDTTLNAGRYDGTLGVLGAIEAVRRLLAGGARPECTIDVVCFAGEEPRFGSGCVGSRAMMGRLTRDDLDELRDRSGTTLAEALRDAGYDPDRLAEARIDPAAVHAFVELHIEQGSVLERHGAGIGVVTHIAAPHDLLIAFGGAAAHAGATPMGDRRDALAGASEAMVALERLARDSSSGSTVATVGVLRALPGAINVIPGRVELEVDVRDSDLGARTAVVDAFVATAADIAGRRCLRLETETITRDDPAACAPLVVDAARAACEQTGSEFIEMVSGAYHDAMILGAEVPIGMVFVPSMGGISHAPEEYTAPKEIDLGVAVLERTLATLTKAG